MKYSREQRLVIGKRIYKGEITINLAAEKYDINYYTARDYLRLYKSELNQDQIQKKKQENARFTLEDYYNMSKDDLIEEVIKAKFHEQEAKEKLKGEWSKGTISIVQEKELEIIDYLSQYFSIKRLCRIADISRSSYYRYKNSH